MADLSKRLQMRTLLGILGKNSGQRKVYQVVPPKVEYSLTDLGKRFVEPLMTLYEWAETHGGLLDELQKNRASAGSSVEQSVL